MASNKLNIFIQDLKNTYTVLQQLELCIKTCKDTLRGFDDLTNHIDELDLDTLNAKLDEINTIIASADLDTLTADVAQLKTNVSALQTMVSGMQQTVNTINNTVGTLNSTVNALNTNVSQLQTNVNDLQTLVTNLQTTISNLTTSVTTNTTDITNLKSRVSTLEGKHLYRHEIEARLYSSGEDSNWWFRISIISNTSQIVTFNDFLNLLYRSIGLMIWNYTDDTPSTIINVDTTNNSIELAVYDFQSHLYNGVDFVRFATDEEQNFIDNVTQII